MKLITEQKQIAESSAKSKGVAEGAGMGIAAAIGGLVLGTILDYTLIGAAVGVPIQAASLSTIIAALGTSAAVGGGIGYFTSSAPKPTPTSVKTDDFTIRTNPADTIVAAGGTNLGRTDEMVSLLSQILHKEGYVSINSTKFGTGYSLGNFKVQ